MNENHCSAMTAATSPGLCVVCNSETLPDSVICLHCIAFGSSDVAITQNQPRREPPGIALELVLHNAKDAMSTRDICALLCCSKSTAACVKQRFTGHLSVSFCPTSIERVQQFKSWCMRNGELLQALKFELPAKGKPIDLRVPSKKDHG